MKKLFNFIIRTILTIIFTAVLLWLVDRYSDGWFLLEATKYDNYITYGFLAIVFFLLNTVLKKILKILTLPLRILTLGLSSIVLNILILYIFKYAINLGEFGIEIHLGDWVQVLILSFLLMLPYLLAKIFK